jgi:lipopolysaccharide transport system permease protein
MASEVTLSAVRKPFRHYLNPVRAVRDLWTHRYLVQQFAVRDVTARYKGARLGLLWSILNPLLMLGIYTFVFSVVFQARWGVLQSGSKAEFALTMFCGLIIFNLFAECANRAPSLIISHAGYVKKIVFPLEILPAAVAASALVFALISTGILLVAVPLFFGTFSATLFFFPLVIFPLLLLSLGVGWFLASLGVYLRDIGHIVTVLVQILMFVTPIFYPISSVPDGHRSEPLNRPGGIGAGNPDVEPDTQLAVAGRRNGPGVSRGTTRLRLVYEDPGRLRGCPLTGPARKPSYPRETWGSATTSTRTRKTV